MLSIYCTSAMRRGMFVTDEITAPNEEEAKKVFFEKHKDLDALFFCITCKSNDAKIMEAVDYLVA